VLAPTHQPWGLGSCGVLFQLLLGLDLLARCPFPSTLTRPAASFGLWEQRLRAWLERAVSLWQQEGPVLCAKDRCYTSFLYKPALSWSPLTWFCFS
jgi:hypothetical protein